MQDAGQKMLESSEAEKLVSLTLKLHGLPAFWPADIIHLVIFEVSDLTLYQGYRSFLGGNDPPETVFPLGALLMRARTFGTVSGGSDSINRSAS